MLSIDISLVWDCLICYASSKSMPQQSADQQVQDQGQADSSSAEILHSWPSFAAIAAVRLVDGCYPKSILCEGLSFEPALDYSWLATKKLATARVVTSPQVFLCLDPVKKCLTSATDNFD